MWISPAGSRLSHGVLSRVALDTLARLYETESDSGPDSGIFAEANAATRLAWQYGYRNPRIPVPTPEKYPYTTEHGETRWACCDSRIGPICEHQAVRAGEFGGPCATPECDNDSRWIPTAHKIRDTGKYYCESCCKRIGDNPDNWHTVD